MQLFKGGSPVLLFGGGGGGGGEHWIAPQRSGVQEIADRNSPGRYE